MNYGRRKNGFEGQKMVREGEEVERRSEGRRGNWGKGRFIGEGG